MRVQKSIEEKLTAALSPEHLQVINESHQHHRGEGAESHFRLIVVSGKFVGQSRVQRQRTVYQLLEQELNSEVHALAQRLFTPEEWRAQGERDNSRSPRCRGGGL